ncbi:MAG: lysophospholipid acyltransferase family protein [Dysgonamonadaceae bacterium]|jgi:KDO2-lipid IV(A) lauroyltransferase|nr:lysophospholipid acyltransferase family protein [Dysgonamonadaceae bacterium]
MNKETTKDKIGYYLLFGISYLHALLPLRVLYVWSDILYLFVYHVVRYRRKIVRKNLVNSFPELSEKEIGAIEKRYYHHLGDYYMETIKILHISDDEMRRRMVFENPEIMRQLTKDGQWCFLALGHYANWEWVSSIGLHTPDYLKPAQIYKKLKNKSFNRLFFQIRSRFQPLSIEKDDTLRAIVKEKNKGKTLIVGFVADQRPQPNSIHYWTNFLNQDTPVQTGMERIARKMGFSMAFLDVKVAKRGYYRAQIVPLTPNASEEPEFSITEQYMRKFEQTILRDPAHYLWSHNRWKFQREH